MVRKKHKEIKYWIQTQQRRETGENENRDFEIKRDILDNKSDKVKFAV